MLANRWNLPDLGFGVGLRSVHYDHILEHFPPVDWFEVISENYLSRGGYSWYALQKIRERYRIVTHGVSLSIGSTDPLNFTYLERLKRLADDMDTPWVSDHICWTGVNGRNTHDLLPILYTEETLRHVVERIRTIQDFLGRRVALENVSTYVEFAASTMPEWEFIARMAEDADCGLLLDVNNVYVSSFNHGFDPYEFIDAIPADRICQYHLAGHTNKGTHIIDTHSDHVVDEVWELYRYAYGRSGGRATLLEWDEDIPPFEVVHAEALKARNYRDAVPLVRGKNSNALESPNEHKPHNTDVLRRFVEEYA
ncbi:MAG: DUF692 domain-containing protein [Candidatus Kapabacteria bacterium]|jgi:hypothetical protein|nr:DUF692 domain-containing protein [Candidatus Kapabacteria bacterium]